jgi:soluble lytic murein transglycosylase
MHNPPRSQAQRAEVARIERYVRSLILRERPTQSINYLQRNDVRSRLTTVEYDRIQQWIAQSYFAEQVDDRALEVAGAVARRNRKAVPLADWTAGLAAWRMGKIELAAVHFEALARAEHLSGDRIAGGAYWAARANLVLRRPDRVLPYLEIAAAHPTTFYGILAKRQLGRSIAIDWTPPPLDEASFRMLMTLDAGIPRAVALAQIGDMETAEEEMRRVHGRLDGTHDVAMMALAMRLNLPHSQMIIAQYGKDERLMSGLFPIPPYEPADGWLVDRALVYAFIRQESKFLTRARSRAGARGLMQVMPITAIDVTGDRGFRNARRLDELYDPGFNMKLGQRYLEQLMNRGDLQGNLFMLAVAYNGGPGNFRRWRAQTDYQGDPLLYIESIPASETRNFIEYVLSNLWLYRARLGQESPSLDAVAAGGWPVYQPVERPDSARISHLGN